MKRSKSGVHYLIASLISVSPAAFGQGTIAIPVAGAESPNAQLTVRPTNTAPLLSEMQTATNGLERTLFIDAPTGGTFRLIYVPEEGWKFADRAMGAKVTVAALLRRRCRGRTRVLLRTSHSPCSSTVHRIHVCLDTRHRLEVRRPRR